MSLFKSPSPPPVVMPPPLPKPDTSAIEARVAEQEARLEQQTKELERTVEQQEERAKAEREREQRRLSASLAARRRGRRLLVSQDRTSPETRHHGRRRQRNPWAIQAGESQATP